MSRATKLLHKDWRVNRMIVVAIVLAGTVPYLLAAAEYFLEWYTSPTPVRPVGTNYIYSASMGAGMFSAVVAAAFGGAAFAVERRDRSAEFLAMLPIERKTIIRSKLDVVGICLLIALFMHSGIRFFLERYYMAFDSDAFRDLAATIAICIGMFGVAWLISSFSTSAAIAACTSIGIIFLTTSFLSEFTWHLPRELLAAIAGCMGLLGLLIGTILYVERIAP